MRAHPALACLLPLLAALGACQRGGSAEWFPLDGGHHWTYRVVSRSEDGSEDVETLTLRSLGHESADALGPDGAWRRRSDDGVDYWLKADPSGVYRVATKSDLDPDPVADKAPRFVLKAPFTVGTQWQASTTAYLLMRRNDFPREIRHSHPSIPMLYQIDAVDAAVDTGAGHFAHCLKVRGSAVVHLYADPASGWRDVPLTTLEWYCRGVGLVRVERSEPANSGFLVGGTRTLDLQSWE